MITVTYLRANLRYEPKTGFLWWKLPGRGRVLSRPAGRTDKNRHVTLSFNYKSYMAHRIIWAMQTGSWPEYEIDHKNRRRSDNRWFNLRPATTSQNRANASLRKDNTSGRKGVSWHARRGKWRARVYVNGREKHLGLFTDKRKAQSAYKTAAKIEYGEYAYAPS